jgi:hypothetical protein
MFSAICALITLYIFGRLLYRMSGRWHRPGRSAMAPKNRVIAILVFAAGMYLLVTSVADFSARRMDIYWAARDQASDTPEFTDHIGEPFSVEWPIALSAEANSDTGYASMKMKVKGSRVRGVLIAAGKKEAGVWRLTQLELRPLVGGDFDLLPPENVGIADR